MKIYIYLYYIYVIILYYIILIVFDKISMLFNIYKNSIYIKIQIIQIQ